ncbi:site-specific recombinase [Noviherbaspirillum pedocola]|uniref:Site-specific recombinase n=1 Tax=Noviherbaspirillum pedocola TaxID=2801341 RepID=A0A934SR22_9BURK|nr:site-specific recombinase [Noviherbaspirillum pedocola]MBK4735015.1 site-specific recombinase [Noviherbaspirillum pedocola]
MLHILEEISLHPNDPSIDALVRLVSALRAQATPRDPGSPVRQLTALLRAHGSHAASLRHYLLLLVSSRRQTSVYTDTGILPSDGFFTELSRRIFYRLLPPALDDVYLQDCLQRILPRHDDHIWIAAVPAQDWLDLHQALAAAPPPAGVPPLEHAARDNGLELIEAMQTLAQRITAMGLEPELIRAHPELEEFGSPFLMLNVEMHRYLEGMRQWLDGGVQPQDDASQALVMLDQCEDVIAKIRRKAAREGISVALTYLLVRMSQSIERLARLLELSDIRAEPAPDAVLDLGLQLVRGHCQRYAMRPLVASNVDLLAKNVTENASRTGGHYIAENRGEYREMLSSSAGAGVIIAFMALFKILLGTLRAAPLVESLLFGLNYAFGFMLIHVLHFTVATKQPAMTASRIATGLHSQDGGSIDTDGLAAMIQSVIRTQLVAVIGNLLTVIPVAFLLSRAWHRVFGTELISVEKAQHLLHDIDPLASLAVPHAALAGICLFLSGVISGYYDNKASYTRMAARIERLRWLRRLFGERRRERIARYVEANLGGLMGNFFFGFLLVSVGMAGMLLGLPLDVRHVTLSASYFAFAVSTLGGIDPSALWRCVAGIGAIGITNLVVSFGLALFVALRARQVRFRQGGKLMLSLLRLLRTRPLGFLLPPRDMPAQNTAS